MIFPLPYEIRAAFGLRRFFHSFLAVLLMFAAGCATRHPATQPASDDDIAEARQNVTDSLSAVQSMLHALDLLSQLNGLCPPEMLTQFATNVHRLQADSFKLRSHAQAMHSRGNAYFDEWQSHLASADDVEVRKSAGEGRQSLQQSFDSIQQASQQTSEAFKPFISEVRTLRRALESEPSPNANDSTKELIRKAKDDGQKLRQDLEITRRKLETVTANLTPMKEPAQH